MERMQRVVKGLSLFLTIGLVVAGIWLSMNVDSLNTNNQTHSAYAK